MASKWYDDATTVRGFADALTEAGLLEEQDEFREFFQHPMRYNSAYDVWENLEFPDSESPNWDSFVEAVSGDEEEDEPE